MTTLTPVQLVSPAGSTAGQTLVSTGPSSPPAWSTPDAAALTNVVTVAHGGTGAPDAATARTNLGLGTAAAQNTGTSGAVVPLLNAANTWAAAQTFSVRPTFNGNTPYDSGNLTPGNYQTKVGVADGSSASSGQIGEYLTNTTNGTSLTTAVVNNATSLVLTAGDWDVSGCVRFIPAGSTTWANALCGISTVSVTNQGMGTQFSLQAPMTTGLQQDFNTPTVRISVASTTTVYCVASANFGVSTMTCNGFIRARRAPH